MKNYFNIHAHTHFSNNKLPDSINTPKSLIKTSIEQGLSGVALTDHGLTSGWVDFEHEYNKVKDKHPDFKIAYGCEIYINHARERGSKNFHFVLAAKNFEGVKQIREISSIGWVNSYWDYMTRVPVLPDELRNVIEKSKGNVIASSACLGGELPYLVRELCEAETLGGNVDKQKQKIVDHILFMKDLFGEDYYIECAPSDDAEQIQFNKRVKPIAEAMGVKMIFATDAHYGRPEDREIHSTYLKSKDGERETDSFYKHTFIMSYEEAEELLSLSYSKNFINQMRENTLEIQDKIDSFSLNRTPVVRKAPVIEPDYTPINLEKYPVLKSFIEGDSVNDRFFAKSCINYVIEKHGAAENYLARIEEEADILNFISKKLDTEMTAYLNFLSYYIDMFWDMGSIVGVGRGSAVGFLSARALGITQVDPIEYDLPAFRFLNKERAELPDIDIDISPSKKPLIIEELRKRLGETNVLSVATFGTEATKSALLSSARGYRSDEYPDGIDIDSAQYMSSLIPQERGFLWSLSDSIYGNKEKNRKPVKALVDELELYPGLKESALGIEGLIKQTGLHAAGVIFYEDDIYESNAIMRAPSGELCTQSSLHESEYCGDVKFDFLVTSMIDKIAQTLELLKADGLVEDAPLRDLYNKYLDPSVLDLKDDRIWDAIAKNEVISVFQFDSPVGVKGARECTPKNIYELTNTNALIRLMSDSGESPMARFVRMKNDISEWYSEMDAYGLTQQEQRVLEKYYLRDSGTPATQETVMLALMDSDICGMTLGEVNKVRKTIAKKDMNEIPKLKEKIYADATSGNIAEYIWKTLVEPQLGYAFSVLHSLAYSFIGVQSVVLGTKWPAVYWNAANLIVDSGGTDEDGTVDYGKVAKAIGTFTRRGVKVQLPDINHSGPLFVPVASEDKILYGLNAISGVSASFIAELISKRPYSSIQDFQTKMKPNITQMLGLIKAGCFDSLLSRKEALETFLSETADLKNKLTLSNLPKLLEADLIPEELSLQKRIAVFNIHLKKNQKVKINNEVCYLINGPYEVFYTEFLDENFLEHGESGLFIKHKIWDKYYKTLIEPIKRYIASEQETLLKKFNKVLLDQQIKKYQSGLGTLAEMEIEACGFMSTKDHWMIDLNLPKYGIREFGDFPELPVYENSFVARSGRLVHLSKIEKTLGVCIHRVPNKGLFYLLDKDGVIEVKMPQQQFVQYDKQVSQIGADGKKTIVSKSLFTRGNVLLVQGYREYDQFKAKKYSKTPGHTVSRIISVDDNGKLELDSSRDAI